ncbi:hypothetical protein HOLleu_27302 [Holothuria leucospilota]|uniref:Cystic fibrosis transmembrane conductance regulator n=1 Tax=Holothuria leucospilota TaxID=206669 RepID=A0A9Q1H0R3_HOLLE|nr:hypothetical protein HOLleu_27302 [Holothuria leucospilota]
MARDKQEEDARLDSKPNPMETADCFSRLFFCWLLPLFNYGYKNTLEITDLYQTLLNDSSRHLADKLNREWEKELEKERKTGKDPSLFKAIARTCWRMLLLSGCLAFFQECIFKMGQPILMGILVQYFVEPSSITRQQAYLCALGFSVCVTGTFVLHHQVFFINNRVGMRLRVAVSALIYRKALRLSYSAIGKTTVGQLVNILSNDVNRFDLAFSFIHNIWIVPIQVTTMMVVLWFQMGPTCLVALFTLLLLAPVQGVMGKMFSKLRAKTAILTDERVRIMNEVIAGMRIIKIHAWEAPFTKLVEEARRKEIHKIQRSSYLRGFTLSFFFVSAKLIAYLTFILFAATGNILQSSIIFFALPMFDIVRFSAALALPYSIMYGLETMVTIRRAKTFLLMEELSSDSHLDGSQSHQNRIYVPNHHHSKSTQVNFDDEDGNVVDIDLEERSQLNPGPETSGVAMVVADSPKKISSWDPSKSATTEKETPDMKIGIKNLCGSWEDEASQNKCLDQVTFTVEASELVAVIGPVGCGKSSLFMALLGELPHTTGEIFKEGTMAYTSQQPWVFAGTLKENIVFGRPYNKTKYESVLTVCALKRDISILPDGDLTLIGERGITLSGGQRARVSLARAVYGDADVYLLDDPLSAVDTAVGRHLFERCIKGFLKNKPVILVTHQLQYLNAVDKIVVLKEGKMVDCGTYEELQTRGIDFAALLKEYEDEECKSEKLSRSQSIISGESEGASPEDVALTDDYEEVEDKERKEEGTVSGQVYTRYIRAGSGIVAFSIFMFFNCIAQMFFVLSDWWLSEWASVEETCSLNNNEESCLNDPQVLANFTNFRVDTIGRPFFFYIYSVFIFLLLVISFIRTIWLFQICVNSSKNLHNQMFAAIIRTHMQFFDTNPVGRILNRFSKDIGFMDESLPVAFSDFNQVFFQTLASLITIFIFNPIVIAFSFPLIILFGFVRVYFLATSRDVKRIEGVCRSPIFSHLSSTLQGLTTVRAFRAQDRFVDKFDMYQDIHTESWFAFLVTVRWFGIMLDWLTAAFLIVVTFAAVVSKDLFSLDASEVGLSLTYALGLVGSFQWGVRQSTEIENLMTSTERVIEYSKLKPEAALESEELLDDDWPQKGAIEFEDISLRYSEDGPLVLKGITMSISAREKIGIVGRTGAGKSSLTAALMRLVEPLGTIKIDGIRLGDLGLHDVRKKISFIPQDPTLFTGTLRKNLDPFSEHDDDSLWKVLKEVQLQSAIDEYPEKLEMMVSEGGSNFSVGQRQLLCLARAMLQQNQVLLVDEATANVDLRTDQLIQATIREKFRECTVLTIAHRLNTVMDSDKVLVLDEGRIIEFDEPYILLQDTSGMFSRMVAETGMAESAKLTAVAKANYFETNAKEETRDQNFDD